MDSNKQEIRKIYSEKEFCFLAANRTQSKMKTIFNIKTISSQSKELPILPKFVFYFRTFKVYSLFYDNRHDENWLFFNFFANLRLDCFNLFLNN